MGYAIATLTGLNAAYRTVHDVDIFDGIELNPLIDRETLLGRIFIRCGEFSIGHTDPEFLHGEIINFFKVYKSTFDKWAEVLAKDYEPLENYDRNEYWKDSGNNEDHSGNKTDYKPGSTSTNKRAAYNSNTFENYEQNSTSGKDSTEGISNSNGAFESEHRGRVHGNIGVTTSQQMLESEMNLREKYNIYVIIANKFCDEICIQVYA